MYTTHTYLTLGRESPNTQAQARAALSMERRHAGIRDENWSGPSLGLSVKTSHTPPANSLPVYPGTEDACYQAVPLGLKFHFRSQHLQPFFFLVCVSCGKSEEGKKKNKQTSGASLEVAFGREKIDPFSAGQTPQTLVLSELKHKLVFKASGLASQAPRSW